MHAYRSHTCADLTTADVGAEVRLSGWVHRVRDHGGVLFIDLRDHYGITQVIADSESPAFAALNGVRAEFVVRIDGRVKARDAALVNPKLPTGEIEVYAAGLTVLWAGCQVITLMSQTCMETIHPAMPLIIIIHGRIRAEPMIGFP